MSVWNSAELSDQALWISHLIFAILEIVKRHVVGKQLRMSYFEARRHYLFFAQFRTLSPIASEYCKINYFVNFRAYG